MLGKESNRSVFYDIKHKFGLSLEKEAKNVLPNFYSRIYNYVSCYTKANIIAVSQKFI